MAFPRDAFRRQVLQRAVVLSIAVGGPLAAVMIAVHWRDLAVERVLHEHEGLTLVDLVSDTIARETAVVRSDLLLLLHEPLLGGLLEGQAPNQDGLERDFVTFLGLKRIYDRIRVLDAAGREVAGADYLRGRPTGVEDGDLQLHGDPAAFGNAMSLGPDGIHVSGLEPSTEHGRVERPIKPVIRFAAPAFDEHGVRRGVVVLNYLGERLLRALDDAAAGYPGRLFLLGDDGSYLRGPRPEDEWGLALGHGYRFGGDHPRAWPKIAGTYRGQFLGNGGLFTFRTVRFGPQVGSGLVVVAHTPPEVLRRRTGRWRQGALLFTVLGIPALAFGSLYVSYSAFARRQHEARLADSEGRLRRLSRELLDAQERERASVSRDLHDDLGQLVTLIALDLERARQAGAAGRPEAIERALEGTRRVLERLHEIAFSIRPRMLDDLGLWEAVRSFLTEFEETTGIEVEAHLRPAVQDLPGVVAENAFRILQEALTNIHKHAGTDAVRVDLRSGGDGLQLRIADEGVGFDAEQPVEGLGLLGMRERAELLGGTLSVRSRRGKGTTIEAHLPIRPVEERSHER